MIIFTSSVASVADHIYQNHLLDKRYKTVLFIDTASEPEIGKEEGDDWWLQNDLKGLQNQGYQVDRWSITDKTSDEIEAKLDEYDIIYMCGGNTIYLLQQLQQTGSFDLIKSKVLAGKPYIGTSAGSIVACTKIPAYLEDAEGIELDDYTGFEFCDLIFVPHWGQDGFKEEYLGGRIQAAYDENEPPFLLMSDYHYALVEDGAVRVINTKQ